MPDRLKPHWFHILFALSRGPLHGSAMVEEVLERTDGETKLWPATLYGSLRDLEEAGWIRETPAPDEAPGEGGRRRFYELTVEGRTTLQGELAHLRDIVAVAQDRGLLGKSGA